MGERRGTYRVLVGKSDGKHHFEDQGVVGSNINMDLQEVGWWHGLDEPSVSNKCWEFLD